MFKWIIISALIIAGGILGYIRYSFMNTPSVVAPVEASPRVLNVVHSFKDGVHRYAGEVKLPHSCYALSAETAVDPADPSVELIVLVSTDKMLDQSVCAKFPTRYPFEVVADAPENMTAKLTLDGVELPIKLIETPWQSSTGSYINPVNSNTNI
jgi:hypothetical protein